MGSPSSEISPPGFPVNESLIPERPFPPPTDPERRREPMRRYLVLFCLTVVTTTWAGTGHYLGYVTELTTREFSIAWWQLLIHGLVYSAAILVILGAHELGHYYTCRYYGVEASRPYFLPIPPFLLITGTLGAFIRIRRQIATKRELFDIGIAGPIAGFLVALPVLAVGMHLSRVVPEVAIPPDYPGVVLGLGEPLLWKIFAWLVFGRIAEGYTLSMHPVAFAAWFGLLATALNLFPIGQLDGGHISYAVLGRRSTGLTVATVICLIGLTFKSMSWIAWTVLTVAMLLMFGPRHPTTLDENIPLDRGRRWLALFALVMFVVCFTPAPMRIVFGR